MNDQQPALILYTSGTTGRPKGVIHTHKNLWYQITDLVNSWEYTADDVVLHMLPLHHTHGIINTLCCPAFVGAQIVFDTFDPHRLWYDWSDQQEPKEDHQQQQQQLEPKAAAQYHPKPNVLMAVPTIYAKLLESATQIRQQQQEEPNQNTTDIIQTAVDKTLHEMRLQVSGSAALPVSIKESWTQLTGQVLLERYGMTEIGMALSLPYYHYDDDTGDGSGNCRSTQRRYEGHVGLPLPSVKVRLVEAMNDDDNDENEDLEDRLTSSDPLVKQPRVLLEAGNGYVTTFSYDDDDDDDKDNIDHEENDNNKTKDDADDATNGTIVGKLQVQGPTVLQEYLNRPDAMEEAFGSSSDDNNNNNNSSLRWFDTGDMVEYNPTIESFRILGRTSVDILKVSGYKISALEIERVLLDHPQIVEVVVVGVNDDNDDTSGGYGQQIGVIARLDSSTKEEELSLQELQDWTNDNRLPKYKTPRLLKIVDDISKNAMGKYNKKELVHLFDDDDDDDK